MLPGFFFVAIIVTHIINHRRIVGGAGKAPGQRRLDREKVVASPSFIATRGGKSNEFCVMKCIGKRAKMVILKGLLIANAIGKGKAIFTFLTVCLATSPSTLLGGLYSSCLF